MKVKKHSLCDAKSSDKVFSLKYIDAVYNVVEDKGVKFVTERNSNRLSVYLETDRDVTIDEFSLSMNYKYKTDDYIYVNGYQSWTDSIEYRADGKMYSPHPLMKPILYGIIGRKTGLSGAGDYGILKPESRKGLFYGFSYGYVRNGKDVNIIGSLSEMTGYTMLFFDVPRSEIVIKKDLKGKIYGKGRHVVMEVISVSGEYDKAFDEYFIAQGITPHKVPVKTGYTTWYNYYQDINEKIVITDLNAIEGLETKIDIFQIDDGYQSAIGDWLTCKKDKFPHGMKFIADTIHSKNMMAGLWLAPFAATKESRVFNEHQDWLIKGDDGKPYCVGANWGGFYAIDIFNEEAREYIRHFFDVVLNEWGYDLVKLDFLYAVCVLPRHNMTRGEMMCKAMDFLRECCKDKLILGCGVPLMPAFGKVDYCRIGPDMSLRWKLNRFDSREGVSTPHAINNTIFRRHLDGRAFGNDPDVFLMRDYNINMSFEERCLIARINKLFGKVLFTSDTVTRYNDEQMKTLIETYNKEEARIISANYLTDDTVIVNYETAGKEHYLEFNIMNGQIIRSK